MTRIIFAAFLAVSAVAINVNSAQAQCGYPQFGCGGFCMAVGSRMHAHGPMYDYSAMFGGGGYGNCGGGGCSWGMNRAPMSRGFIGGGLLSGGLFNGNGLLHGGLGNIFHRGNNCDSCHSSGYAMMTFRNVTRRLHPCSGRNCSSNNCGSCGGSVSTGTCSSCGNSVSMPAPTVHAAPATMPTAPK